MDCETTQRRLSAFLDGEAGDMTEDVRDHLERCVSCAHMLEGLRSAGAAWRQAIQVPEGLPDRIIAAIPDRTERFGRRLAAAAAIMAILLWAWVLLPRFGSAPPSSLVNSSILTANEQKALAPAPVSEEGVLGIIFSGEPQ